jgi:hypothetical protein
VLLLANADGGRMLARAGQPGAVARARDLHETLGAAADGADLLADGGAAPPRFARAA